MVEITIKIEDKEQSFKGPESLSEVTFDQYWDFRKWFDKNKIQELYLDPENDHGYFRAMVGYWFKAPMEWLRDLPGDEVLQIYGHLDLAFSQEIPDGSLHKFGESEWLRLITNAKNLEKMGRLTQFFEKGKKTAKEERIFCYAIISLMTERLMNGSTVSPKKIGKIALLNGLAILSHFQEVQKVSSGILGTMIVAKQFYGQE